MLYITRALFEGEHSGDAHFGIQLTWLHQLNRVVSGHVQTCPDTFWQPYISFYGKYGFLMNYQVHIGLTKAPSSGSAGSPPQIDKKIDNPNIYWILNMLYPTRTLPAYIFTAWLNFSTFYSHRVCEVCDTYPNWLISEDFRLSCLRCLFFSFWHSSRVTHHVRRGDEHKQRRGFYICLWGINNISKITQKGKREVEVIVPQYM